MKKIIIVAVFLLAAAGVLNAGDVKEQPKETKKAVTWDDWRAAQKEASNLDDEKKYEEAVVKYIEYGNMSVDLKRPDLKAWGYNNAAYCMIKMHMKDNSVDLNRAKVLLEEAMDIKEATEDCAKCMEDNMRYVKYKLGLGKEIKAETVKPKQPVTPEKKK